ncbi:MAG: 1,2-phenylacetyl-CoA epoxidase subunit PaaD [Planctomycetota bacterium]|jgi:ring-1,2-phenylacetyl-CoA epoxidase subunit PaaD
MVAERDVMTVLRTIPDPEMPISIVDLGLVEAVEIDADGAVSITMLPTFVGCPALDMIRADVESKVGALDGVRTVRVRWVNDPAWSVDRITEPGRASLREHGVVVPERTAAGTTPLTVSAVACPFCGSRSTSLESAFGPTRCRSIFYCDACGNSFEQMKRITA